MEYKSLMHDESLCIFYIKGKRYTDSLYYTLADCGFAVNKVGFLCITNYRIRALHILQFTELILFNAQCLMSHLRKKDFSSVLCISEFQKLFFSSLIRSSTYDLWVGKICVNCILDYSMCYHHLYFCHFCYSTYLQCDRHYSIYCLVNSEG